MRFISVICYLIAAVNISSAALCYYRSASFEAFDRTADIARPILQAYALGLFQMSALFVAVAAILWKLGTPAQTED